MYDDDSIPLADDSSADSGGSFDIDSLAAQSIAKTARHAASTKQGKPFLWVAVGVAVAIIGACIIAVIMGNSSDTKIAESKEPQKKLASSSDQAAPQIQPIKDHRSAPADTMAISKKDRPSLRTPEATPADSDETLEREARERRQRFLSGQAVNSGLASQQPSFDEKPTKKAPAPDANALADAEKRIKEAYGNEWAGAKTDEAKKALARKLLQKAWESDKDNAARFVLLRSSRDIATQAMDGWTAFRAIEDMDHLFQVDALEMRATVLSKGALIASSAGQHGAVANKAAEVSDEAVVNDNFTIANQLNDLALGEARKGNDLALVKRASQRVAEIEELSQLYEAVKTATVTLKSTPGDPEANLTIGKYKCFAKGDWEGGLLMLALGSDQTLKTLASKELAGVASSDEQARLGDGWWDLAVSREGLAKEKFRERAAFWYRTALPGLSGLTKGKVEKRLQLDSRTPLK